MNKFLQTIYSVAACLALASYCQGEETSTPSLTALKSRTVNGYVGIRVQGQPGSEVTSLWLRNHEAPIRSYGGLAGPTPSYRPIRNYGGPTPSLRPLGPSGDRPTPVRTIVVSPGPSGPPIYFGAEMETVEDWWTDWETDILEPETPLTPGEGEPTTELPPALLTHGAFQAIPEPSTWTLLAIGGLAIVFGRKRSPESVPSGQRPR